MKSQGIEFCLEYEDAVLGWRSVLVQHPDPECARPGSAVRAGWKVQLLHTSLLHLQDPAVLCCVVDNTTCHRCLLLASPDQASLLLLDPRTVVSVLLDLLTDLVADRVADLILVLADFRISTNLASCNKVMPKTSLRV